MRQYSCVETTVRRVLLVVIAACNMTALGPTLAHADPIERMIRKGVELRRRGQDAKALPHFHQAYEESRGHAPPRSWALRIRP